MGQSAAVSRAPANRAEVRRLTLIVPGLVPIDPEIPAVGLELPADATPNRHAKPPGGQSAPVALESSLDGAERGWKHAFDWHGMPDEAWECALYRLCGRPVAAGELPAARLRWPLDGLEASACPEYLVCADPVHLQVERDSVSVLPPEALAITLDEARACANSLNAFLGGDGLEVIVATPEHWYLTGHDPNGLEAPPTHAVARRYIVTSLADSADAARWRQLNSEMQMLLHGHAVNLERSRRNQLPINSLWLCGGARLPEAASLETTLGVYSDDEEVQQLASSLGVKCQPSSAPYQEAGITLRVDLSLYKAWLSGDAERIETAREALVQSVILPALESLRGGQWASVTALVGDGLSGDARPALPSASSAMLRSVLNRWLARLQARMNS